VETSSQTAATVTTPTTAVSRTEAVSRMRDRIGYQPAAVEKHSPVSAPLRAPWTIRQVCEALSDVHGEAPATWENRLCGEASHYRRVGLMNQMLRRGGRDDKVAELMAPIDASVEGEPQPDARLREGLTDAHEDAAQAAYDCNPCIDTARTLLQKRAAERQASLDHDREIAARHGMTL